jgi:hypothetical protein
MPEDLTSTEEGEVLKPPSLPLLKPTASAKSYSPYNICYNLNPKLLAQR